VSRPPWYRDAKLALLLAATLLGLGIGFWVKEPCSDVNPDTIDYGALCYTDLPWIYKHRDQHADGIPYVDSRFPGQEDGNSLQSHFGFLEYPVLTGLFIHFTAVLSDSSNEFYLWNVVLLSILALATSTLLYYMVDDRRRVALFALGPPLYLYAFHNWDLLALFFVVLAFYAYQKDHAGTAGIAIALGACAKIYPIFLAPILGLAILRREGRVGNRSLSFGFGVIGPIIALNLPFYLANRELFLETYRFHMERTPTWETIWYALGHYGREWNIDWLAAIGTEDVYGPAIPILLFAGLALICVVTWRRRDPVAASFAVIALFLAVNKVFSVQYTIWLLPFFALMPLRGSRFVSYVVTDLAVYVAVFTFFDHMWTEPNRYFDDLTWTMLARLGVLMGFIVAYVRGNLLEPTPTMLPQKPIVAATPTTDGPVG
jgi:hypothetical protein